MNLKVVNKKDVYYTKMPFNCVVIKMTCGILQLKSCQIRKEYSFINWLKGKEKQIQTEGVTNMLLDWLQNLIISSLPLGKDLLLSFSD